jgi:chromosome segregation ATPase
MWIERIDFAGFGSISGEKIEFVGDKLNLVVEPNEYGKSTMATAIWAILYDFPLSQRTNPARMSDREARRPRKGLDLPYIASIDVRYKGRCLKVIRDFDDSSVQVVDIDKNFQDCTAEFLGSKGEDEVGLRMTGMSRELFRSTCFVGQRELDEYSVGGDGDLAQLFQGIADASSPATNAQTAISILDETLHHFPYKGKKAKIDYVIRDLEFKYHELSEKVERLEEDRRTVGRDLRRSRELDTEIVDDEGQNHANEYFHLCLEVADIDNRLIKAQERLVKIQELQQELERIGNMDEFPSDGQKSIEDLFVRRQSRQTDYNRLVAEVEPALREYDSFETNVHERFEGLQFFNEHEAQVLGVMTMTFRHVCEEIDDLKRRRDSEAGKVEDVDVDVNSLEDTRRALQALDPKDYDDARSYSTLINSARDQVSECEKAVWKARTVISEVEEERNQKKIMFFAAASHRKKDVDAAEKEIQKQSGMIQELRTKIENLESRLDSIAQKAGMVDGKELLRRINEYSSKSSNLKELDAIDQNIASRQSSLDKSKEELRHFFNRAGRQATEITVDNALELLAAVQQYIEEKRKMASQFATVTQSRGQLDFLQGEIQDIDNQLRLIFAKAGIQDVSDIEVAYREFYSKLAAYHHWESIRSELHKMETDMSSGFTPDELPPQIERLENQRLETCAQMQQLVERFPDIAELGPVMAMGPRDRVSARGTNAVSSANTKMYLEDLRKERDELTVRVRSSAKNFDDNYLNALEEMESIEKDLGSVKRAKIALELARDTLRRLSGETYVDWSTKLNEIAKDMLENLGLDYEDLSFDSQLKLTAQRKGEDEKLGPAQITSQLSVGTREQLHWLARMVVSRFLSSDEALPIILDEPFSESDDERFTTVMKFLIDVLSRQHQVIVFSCHQQRHFWLIDQLDQEKERIEFCRRGPLA